MPGSQKLLEHLAALKVDAHRMVEQLQVLCEGVEDLHTQLAEADRKVLREQRESLEAQIMDMIDEFDDPSFPRTFVTYFLKNLELTDNPVQDLSGI